MSWVQSWANDMITAAVAEDKAKGRNLLDGSKGSNATQKRKQAWASLADEHVGLLQFLYNSEEILMT